MKKTISLFLVLTMLLCFAVTGCAAEDTAQTVQAAPEGTIIVLAIGSPNMTVNGEEKQIDSQGMVPVIVGDRTLLPIRAVMEAMGGQVDWNEETRGVTLTLGTDVMQLTIDRQEAQFNGETKTLDVAPTVIGDRTMLPIRFVAESFQFHVVWDEQTETVTISGNSRADSKPLQPAENTEPHGKSLVVYFSATGNTKALAEKIAAAAGADLFEIVPEVPYTDEDLNYNNSDCRANKEQNDDSARPAIANKVENMESYDIVFIGYPIWWGTMPKVIRTFLETYDLSGKTIMPFCTSGGSGITSSVSAIKETCPNAVVCDGLRGTSRTDENEIESWFAAENFQKD